MNTATFNTNPVANTFTLVTFEVTRMGLEPTSSLTNIQSFSQTGLFG